MNYKKELKKRPVALVNKSTVVSKINKFYPKEYIEILYYKIIPKIEFLISDLQKRQNWHNLFNQYMQQTNLNYSSEETYLLSHNLSKNDVVANSILYTFSNLNLDDIEYLVKQFSPLMLHLKIRVLKEDNIAIYTEILSLIKYIKSIQNLIKSYQTPYSDHKGTAHRSSSIKKLVNTQINLLEKRLDNSYFKIKNEDEIKRTELIIKLLKISLDDRYSNIMELFNFGKYQFGLNMKLLDLSELELDVFNQVLDFYNGVRSKPHELVRSVMIYADYLFKKCDLSAKEKSNYILEIVRFFFTDELKEASKNKNTLSFNNRHIGKPYRIKTILHEVPIFAYNYKDSNDFLVELIETGISGFLGIKNIFEPDNPHIEDISWVRLGKNMINFRNEFGFTRKEFKVLLYFIPID